MHGDAVVRVFGELMEGTGSGSVHQWVRGEQVGHQRRHCLGLTKCHSIIPPGTAPDENCTSNLTTLTHTVYTHLLAITHTLVTGTYSWFDSRKQHVHVCKKWTAPHLRPFHISQCHIIVFTSLYVDSMCIEPIGKQFQSQSLFESRLVRHSIYRWYI